MFIDEAKIFVKAGDGGNGCVSFRREKNVPHGGPDGGSGGNGSDIIIEASDDLATLIDFQHKVHFKSESGQHGMGRKMHGKNRPEFIIKVPVGTVIKKIAETEFDRINTPKHFREEKEEIVIADLVCVGQRVVVAKAGKGGRGNETYKSSTNQAPRTAQKGTAGEEATIKLELKLIADVGFIGYPNAGKSTLLSKLSNAKPKVGSYPFTTLDPYLGIMTTDDLRKITLADLPGLIEDAHKGKGLGFRFLRHAERTKVILHVVDLSGYDQKTPLANFKLINKELELYNPEFMKKPQIVVANKIDLAEAKKNLKAFSNSVTKKGYTVIPVSGDTGEGIEELKKEIFKVFK